MLEPFDAKEKPRRIIDRKDCFRLPKNQVTVIPLKWFEKDYQVMVSEVHKAVQDEEEDNNKAVQAKLRAPDDELDGDRYLFKNGNITKVLNPQITDPYDTHDRQIKLGEKWIGLEFAMLGTRTKYGQFVLSISTLTEV
jgi:hypothetical protein